MGASPSMNMMRPTTSAVPAITCTRAPDSSTRGLAPSRPKYVNVIIKRIVWPKRPATPSISPRSSAATASPTKLSATRWPGNARGVSPCTWIPRTRQTVRDGKAISSSPTATGASCSVPVTTVPTPLIVKQRSIGRRGAASVVSARARQASQQAATCSSSAASRSSIPAPVLDDTGTIDASANTVSERKSSTSSSASSIISLSARSHIVSATTMCVTPNSSSTCTCSRVCGITPSTADTTNTATSMPVAPCTMARR